MPHLLRGLVLGALAAWCLAELADHEGLRRLGTLVLLTAPWVVVVVSGAAAIRARDLRRLAVAAALLGIAVLALVS